MFEKEAEFQELLKKRLTSLKTFDSLDMCTRTELVPAILLWGNRSRKSKIIYLGKRSYIKIVKKAGDFPKKKDSLDTRTRTELISALGNRGNHPGGNKKYFI